MRTKEQFLEYQLCCLDAKCPCGGYFNDFHSHASDCLIIGGDKEYKWNPDMETPDQRNYKYKHEIKNKLGNLYTLPQLITREMPNHDVHVCAEQCFKIMPKILELLDKIK